MVRYPEFTVPPAESLPPRSQEEVVVPDNLFVLTSHGTDRYPHYERIAEQLGLPAPVLSEFFKDPAHAADGSDVAVGGMGRFFADRNADAAVGQSLAGRMFINPNGDASKAMDVQIETFGHAPIWAEGKQPAPAVQEQLKVEVWDTYHDRVQAGIETVVLGTPEDPADPNDHVLLVDIHDTDPKVFNKNGKLVKQEPVEGFFGFPLLLVSDQDGKAAHPLVRQTLGLELLHELVNAGVVAYDDAYEQLFKQNEMYKGGFTTKQYGINLPNAYLLRGEEALKVKAEHMHFIQIELNRAMYVNPDRRGLDTERYERTRQAVGLAVSRTANLIRNLELGTWRKLPAVDSPEYQTAIQMPLLAGTDLYQRAAKSRPAI